MNNVICAHCWSMMAGDFDRLRGHNEGCDLHPDALETPRAPTQRLFMDESDTEAIARLWRAVEANP